MSGGNSGRSGAYAQSGDSQVCPLSCTRAQDDPPLTAACLKFSVSQAATLESLSKKLSDDLRRHIKTLGSFALMSKEWLAMVESLQHISSIAVMEQKLPKQSGQDVMTLWDKDDMAVRMVLEEGKLNMCLRVLQVRRVV